MLKPTNKDKLKKGKTAKKAKNSNDMWKSVESSNLHKVRYRRVDKLLDIVFHYNKFRVYTYEKVPFNVYSKLIVAESVGDYFKSFIKDRFVSTINNFKDII